jgi:hypothetical protein
VDNQQKIAWGDRSGGVNTSRGGWRLIAGVVMMLVALVLVGRLQGRNLGGDEAAVVVGEGAVWVLLEQGTLLRVDPDRHQVTGRLELGAPTGLLAVGAGAVWVGNGQATVTARVDSVRLRVTARFGG